MGTKLSRVLTLELLLTRWMNFACRALEPAEREVVYGDLFEAEESGWLALREVLGLVIRRRVLNSSFARSCLAIGTLTISATFLLTLLATRIADGSAIYLWMWINNSDWAVLQTVGFWRPVLELAPGLLFSYITLVCCSWTCGLLLGWASRRTCWLSGLLLLATVASIGVCGLPDTLGDNLVLWSARDYIGNAAVFSGIFYRNVFPAAIELFLLVLPAWWGMRRSSTIRQFESSARLFMLLLCLAVFGSLLGQDLVSSGMQVLGTWPLRYLRLPGITPMAISGPIAYCFLLYLHRLSLHPAARG